MASEKTDVSRRNFLKKSAALGVGAAVWPAVLRRASAASRDRVVIYHSSVADSIHPYNHSSSPIYGNWTTIRKSTSVFSPSHGSSRASSGCSSCAKASNFITALH
jgi:uncharacterized protein (DUF1501 family)